MTTKGYGVEWYSPTNGLCKATVIYTICMGTHISGDFQKKLVMLQILCVNSCLTPSALSVQDYAYVGPQNLYVHWARKCHQPALASRILDLGAA